ncbi:hypothetical protein BC940DRAFT_95584 [Gongronella butleri]|nr:hypothetical protein BC940DRAFT_95584 [Gongronella butleri]
MVLGAQLWVDLQTFGLRHAALSTFDAWDSFISLSSFYFPSPSVPDLLENTNLCDTLLLRKKRKPASAKCLEKALGHPRPPASGPSAHAQAKSTPTCSQQPTLLNHVDAKLTWSIPRLPRRTRKMEIASSRRTPLPHKGRHRLCRRTKSDPRCQ